MRRNTILLMSSIAIVAVTTTVLITQIAGGNKVYHIVTFNTNGGTPVSNIEVRHGYKISAPQTEKPGYHVDNWSDDDKRVWNFDVDVVVKDDITLTAYWKPTQYTITYNVAGGTMPEVYETTYTIESDFDFIKAFDLRLG